MTHKPNTSRRRFLTTLGAGGVAAAAVAVTYQSGPEQPASTGSDRQGKGYQVTAHVRNYYRTAKV